MAEDRTCLSAQLTYAIYLTSLFPASWHGRKARTKVTKKILYYIFFTNALSPSYPVLYMMSLIHFHHRSHHPHHRSSNNPLESRRGSTGGSTQTEFFSTPSWMEAWHFFSQAFLFFPNISLAGGRWEVYRGLNKGRKGREALEKEEILWRKKEGIWRESYFCKKLAKSCLYVTDGMTVTLLPESLKTTRKAKQRYVLSGKELDEEHWWK
jgi:hypothetical protein